MSRCGVYKIECIPTGRFYIGSTCNIRARKARHLRQLRNGNHHNLFLQRVYDKHGEESLKFSFRETEDVDAAHKLEQDYLYTHLLNPLSMNIGVHVSGGDNLSRNPKKLEIIARTKATLLAKMEGLTKEERSMLYGSPGVLNAMFGKTHTAEARLKISLARVGKPWNKGVRKSDEAKLNMSIAARKRASASGYVNGFQGKTHSETARRRMSEVNKGRKPPNVRAVRVGRRQFDSLRAAAKHLGVVTATVLYRVHAASYPDYTYID